MKTLLISIALSLPCFLASASATYGDVKLTHIKPTKEEANWIREQQVSPKYPVSLAQKGIIGCGIFKVTVNENGRTDSVELIQSTPEKVIYKPSKEIIKKWRWMLTPNGNAQAEEKIIRLDYCLGGQSLEEAQALCLKQSQFNCGD
ncbi:energy transducer TonB [Pseudoalteromonas fenneropenaei]|uniref:Energy transducer TonB n=1 Tax=Pseudoalteromonas fenneropenaei TaxID=1737459 RepID=A0ABV7CNI9_9GAMM